MYAGQRVNGELGMCGSGDEETRRGGDKDMGPLILRPSTDANSAGLHDDKPSNETLPEPSNKLPHGLREIRPCGRGIPEEDDASRVLFGGID